MSNSQPSENGVKEARIPPIIVLGIGIFAASTASIFIRFAQESVSSLVIAAFRLSIASVVLAPVAIKWQHRELRALTGKQLGLLVLSGVFLALHFASWITSLEYTTVATSVILVSTSSLWVALLAPLFLRERVSLMLGIGLLVALVGGVIVGSGQACELQNGTLACPPLADFIRGESLLGNLLALGGAISGAAYLLIGKRVRGKISLLSYTFIVYGMSAIVLMGMVAVTQQRLTGYSPAVYLLFVALALIPQLLGHSSFNWALRYMSATYVSVTLLGEPISSTILAYIILEEVPALLEIIGGVLILVGIYLASRSEGKRE